MTARPGSESRADAERVAQEPGRARCLHVTGEPEGRRETKVRACAESTRGRTGANQRVLPWYRQAKATKCGEKGNEQS